MFRTLRYLIKLTLVIAVFVALYELATDKKDPKDQWYRDNCYSIEYRLYPTDNGKWETEILNGYNKDIIVFYEVKVDTISKLNIVEIKSGKTTGVKSLKLKEGETKIDISYVLRSDNGKRVPCGI